MSGYPLSRPLIESARELRDRRASARELVEAAIARHEKSHGEIDARERGIEPLRCTTGSGPCRVIRGLFEIIGNPAARPQRWGRGKRPDNTTPCAGWFGRSRDLGCGREEIDRLRDKPIAR